jgi:hypothetical protein
MKGDFTMYENQCLCAFELMGPMTAAQLGRFLEDAKVSAFDRAETLAALVEKKLLNQTVSLQGILYVLTQTGAELLKGSIVKERKAMAGLVPEYKRLFDREKDYMAQYTERANCNVPVFLSIRDGDKIVLNISVIVDSVALAKEITSKWLENAHGAYNAVWDAVGCGAPVPSFYTKLKEKEGL